ncbi:hypothetical protein N136_01766 [Leifsonia aquatica ATCC 14665]|uniref:Uncharacterized protein n=1 Tax=Leifsonia aquatica ATCC 14665 TaxID=1358026 RepID=U2R9D5_LEIAQ|nr:hypothetical protein N136_01766 [Leifsonia aquatica ATCC 14665]
MPAPPPHLVPAGKPGTSDAPGRAPRPPESHLPHSVTPAIPPPSHPSTGVPAN